MLITTIICNYNYGKYISTAIESALNQTVPTDIIVIDDGSNDNSIEIIKSYPVKLLHTPNLGPSSARNLGIQNSLESDAWAILDADDWWELNRLEICKAYIESGIGAIYNNYFTIDENNNYSPEYKEPFSYSKLLKECIVHSGCIITKEAIIDILKDGYIYDPEMRTCEDYDLWIRIAKKFTIAHVAEFLTYVRIHSQNSTNTVSKEIWNQNWNRIRKKMLQ